LGGMGGIGGIGGRGLGHAALDVFPFSLGVAAKPEDT